MQIISKRESAISKLTADFRPSRMRCLRKRLAANVFSLPTIFLFVFIVPIFTFSVISIAEPDIWWHLRNARFILENHALPRVDVYSFGAAGSTWMDHEWLSEIVFYFGFKTMGLQGVVAVYIALLLLIFAGVFYRTYRAGAGSKNAAITTGLAILFAVVSIGPRMLLFGWLCMVALLLVLDHFRRSGKGLWRLPILFALWINFHGSWAFGMVVLLITIAAGLIGGEWGQVVARRWSSSELKKLLIALPVSMAALLVNPFGYRLALYPFDLLFRQTSNMKYVSEWQSVDFNSVVHGKLGMAIVLGLLAAAWFSRRRWSLSDVMLAAFAVWSGLSHVRMLFFAGLILAPILGPRLDLFPPYESERNKAWLNAAIMTAIVGWLIYLFPSEANLQQTISAAYPTAALEFMQQQHVSGPIFNVYHWGGYMEWMAPDLKPFIDSRADIFIYNGTSADYDGVVFLQKPFEVLNKYKFDYVLFPPQSSLCYLLDHSPEWHIIYSDQVAKLYERASAKRQLSDFSR